MTSNVNRSFLVTACKKPNHSAREISEAVSHTLYQFAASGWPGLRKAHPLKESLFGCPTLTKHAIRNTLVKVGHVAPLVWQSLRKAHPIGPAEQDSLLRLGLDSSVSITGVPHQSKADGLLSWPSCCPQQNSEATTQTDISCGVAAPLQGWSRPVPPPALR